MRSSRALGQALVAAVACVADDPPPPAGESHGLVPEARVVEQFVAPTANRYGWKPLERGTRFVHAVSPGSTDSRPVDETGPKSRAPLMRVALGAAGLDRVRDRAMAIDRDRYQRRPRAYGNTPPAERAPPTPLTDSRRGDQP
ncbi:MAG TPA: hypothetical protein VKP10_10325 [Gemmatimonadales bacterium]|nr:hypothetical protein [Gemmatimonadales bacterium]